MSVTKPEWHQDWLDTQGFLHNDDDLFYNPQHVGEPDKCDACGGSGDRVSGYQSEGKLRVQPCRTCGGKGFVEIKS